MPGEDHTGPYSRGPRTGRGRGRCGGMGGASRPDTVVERGRGFGRGRGRRFGGGRGLGYGRRLNAANLSKPATDSAAEED